MKCATARLGDLCSVITKGTTPRTLGKEYVTGGIPFLRAENLLGDKVALSPGTLFIDDATHQLLSRSVIKPGDVLISIAGTIGRCAIVPSNIPIMNCNQAVAIARIDGPLDRRFLLHWLKTQDAQRQISGAKVTQTISNLSLRQIRNLLVPLPPMSEQKRMVQIIDQADALRKKRAEAHAKAARILPALFYKMFGDPATNPKRWNTGCLDDIILETQYGTSTKANTNGDGLPVLRMNNIDIDGHLDLTDLKYVALKEQECEKYSLDEGDILFNRTNSKELVGKTGLWRGEMKAVYASYLIRVRINRERALPEFIWAYMNNPFIKQALLNKSRRAIGMANINAKELRDLPLMLPAKDWQKSFANHLAGLETLRVKRKRNAQALDRLFATLLHGAFVGHLTAKWRETHMKELLAEMEQQAKALEAGS